MKSLLCFGMIALTGLALGGKLEWIGASGGTWDATSENWQDESGTPSAWVDGSTAVFGDQGDAAVTVSGTRTLGGLVFKGQTAPTISGGTLAFAADMPIEVRTDKGATIASALSPAGGFSLTFALPADWAGLLPCKGTEGYDWMEGRAVTLWKNVSLDQVDIAAASVFTRKMNPLTARAYHPTWKDGKLTVQFQYDTTGGDGIYCVIAEFAQDGADVLARVVQCRARKNDVDGNPLKLGDDFVLLDETGRIAGGVMKVLDGVLFTDDGLGIKDFVAVPKKPLVLSGNWTPAGVCSVNDGFLKVVISGGNRDYKGVGNKFTGNGGLIATTTDGSMLELCNGFKNELTGGLTADGMTFRVSGSSGETHGSDLCGPGCPVRVVNGGTIYCLASANESFGDADKDVGTTLYVGPKSRLRIDGSKRNLQFVKTIVDGGKLQFDDGAFTQVKDLTLMNNLAKDVEIVEKVDGAIRLGHSVMTPRLTTDGPSAVTVGTYLRICKDGNASWDRQYTTFETRADLILTKGLLTATVDDGWSVTGVRVRKCGAGKMTLDYSQDDFPADIQMSRTDYPIDFCVDEGTLVFGKSHAVGASEPLSLYGMGKASFVANTETVVSTLTVGGTNEMEFAAGSTFACSALAFGNGARLNLTGAVGDKTVRVGTSKCLTDGELAKIRIDNHAVLQDEDGYLVKSGLVVLIK